MDIIRIIFTVVGVVLLSSIVGWLIRRFNITTMHLGILGVLGFGLIFIGESVSTAIMVIGIIMLTIASRGFFYMHFMGGKK